MNRRVKTSREVIEEELKLHPYLKPRGSEAVVTMVVPGARSLGETWVKVTVGHDGNNIVVDRESADAPADNRPVMAMSGADSEYTNYILTAAAEKSKGRLIHNLSPEEKFAAVNEAWQAFVEQKLRWFKGQSTFGPGGAAQRQRVHHRSEG